MVYIHFCNVLPAKYLNRSEFWVDDWHLLLSHLIKPGTTYGFMCSSLKGTKILDNGMFEDSLEGFEDLLEKAKTIKANYVVLPDTDFDKNFKWKTIDMACKAKKQGFKVLAVCTGTNYDEAFECFDVLNSINEVDLIGIVARKTHFVKNVSRIEAETKRINFLHQLESRFLFEKPLHLLGVHDCELLCHYKAMPFVRSIDSTYPFKLGFHGIRLPISPKEDVKRPENYFAINKVNEKQVEIIKHNVWWLKNEIMGNK